MMTGGTWYPLFFFSKKNVLTVDLSFTVESKCDSIATFQGKTPSIQSQRSIFESCYVKPGKSGVVYIFFFKKKGAKHPFH